MPDPQRDCALLLTACLNRGLVPCRKLHQAAIEVEVGVLKNLFPLPLECAILYRPVYSVMHESQITKPGYMIFPIENRRHVVVEYDRRELQAINRRYLVLCCQRAICERPMRGPRLRENVINIQYFQR